MFVSVWFLDNWGMQFVFFGDNGVEMVMIMVFYCVMLFIEEVFDLWGYVQIFISMLVYSLDGFGLGDVLVNLVFLLMMVLIFLFMVLSLFLLVYFFLRIFFLIMLIGLWCDCILLIFLCEWYLVGLDME